MYGVCYMVFMFACGGCAVRLRCLNCERVRRRTHASTPVHRLPIIGILQFHNCTFCANCKMFCTFRCFSFAFRIGNIYYTVNLYAYLLCTSFEYYINGREYTELVKRTSRTVPRRALYSELPALIDFNSLTFI